MRTPMNFLLVNLAVADMTVAVFIAIRYIFTLVFVHPKGEIGDFVCQLLTGEAFTWVGALASRLHRFRTIPCHQISIWRAKKDHNCQTQDYCRSLVGAWWQRLGTCHCFFTHDTTLSVISAYSTGQVLTSRSFTVPHALWYTVPCQSPLWFTCILSWFTNYGFVPSVPAQQLHNRTSWDTARNLHGWL